ncbi:MAG TPA: hypothetical protein VF515_16565 [Candidatus Binatia bacterium]|jgi:hypothetical protein
MVEVLPNKPAGYESDLSDFGPCVFDGYCGEPIGWGFKIVRRLSYQRFEALRGYGSLDSLYSEHLQPEWCLVTRWLSREEAQRRYGEIAIEEFGPRGGWRSVTFGTKKFMSHHLKGNPRVERVR